MVHTGNATVKLTLKIAYTVDAAETDLTAFQLAKALYNSAHPLLLLWNHGGFNSTNFCSTLDVCDSLPGLFQVFVARASEKKVYNSSPKPSPAPVSPKPSPALVSPKPSPAPVSPSGCCGRAVEPPPLACLPACLPAEQPLRGRTLPSGESISPAPCLVTTCRVRVQ